MYHRHSEDTPLAGQRGRPRAAPPPPPAGDRAEARLRAALRSCRGSTQPWLATVYRLHLWWVRQMRK